MLTSNFVRRQLNKGVHFVSREEDLGDEGLKVSKRSWNPCAVQRKFYVQT